RRPFGTGVSQRRSRRKTPRYVLSEADNPFSREVAAHHALRGTREKRLLNQATSAPETTCEARNERIETEFFRRTVIRMLHGYDAAEARSSPWLCELDLPNPQPAVSAGAFQHARPTRKPGRERFAQTRDIVIQPDVAAPAEGARSVEDLLCS